MKIPPSSPNRPLTSVSTDEARARPATEARAEDRVSFTSGAAAVAAALAPEKEERAERLKRLEAAIKSGTYNPDPGDIADSMVETSDWLMALDNDLTEEKT